jgi:hypothetical protein
MLTHFDSVVYVDIDYHALGQQILTYSVMVNDDINDVVKICRHRALSSMLTLRPKAFSVDLERNFHFDLLNFDLNNSTRFHIIEFTFK